MFESFYQLQIQPFEVSPDPRFLHLSGTHREAFSSLLYRIQANSGFLAMVAEPGMGKTMLLFHLLHRLQGSAKTAFIFQTQCTSNELLRHLLSEFECDSSITDPVRMSQELKSFLLREANAGRRCVLIIDEAQNLQPEVLETIRLLSNFETPRRKLLQIILSGQSELGEMLASTELRQLRQRLSCIVSIHRFAPEETALYIAHRLRVAGHKNDVTDLFSLQALTRIAQLSDGVPRVINNICFNALSLGFALERRQIGREIIEEVAVDLGLSSTPTAAADQSIEPPAASLADYLEKGITGSWIEDSDAFTAVAAICTNHEHTAPTAVMAETAPEDEIPEVSADLKVVAADQASEPHPVASKEATLPAIIEPQARPVLVPELLATEAARTEHEMPVAVKTRAKVRETPKNLSGRFLMRGCACSLLLCIAPAIDTPTPHTVSAGSIQPLSQPVNSAIATQPPMTVSKSHRMLLHAKRMEKADVDANFGTVLGRSEQPGKTLPLNAAPTARYPVSASSLDPKSATWLPTPGRSQSTSQIEWPAVCRQGRYDGLHFLVPMPHKVQPQQPVFCSFFASSTKRPSTR